MLIEGYILCIKISRFWYTPRPYSERIRLLASLFNTTIYCACLLYLSDAKEPIAPVLLDKDATGCIWVSEKTSYRQLGE
jgi:hypothetical protein